WIDHIRIWSWPDLQPAGEFGPVRAIASLAFSPDGQLLVSGAAEGELTLWDVRTRTPRHRRTGVHSRSTVGTARFSPDGRLIATAGGDQIIVLWDAAR